MRKLCTLAAAGALFFGLSSTAMAAPVIVTYGIAPRRNRQLDPSLPGITGSGTAGGR